MHMDRGLTSVLGQPTLGNLVVDPIARLFSKYSKILRSHSPVFSSVVTLGHFAYV